jgi:2-oxo-4-hydroxy-4-carboxy-5-ureidoimidazoline decarboxylase
MINKINNLSKAEFAQMFGNIFENASWIAKKLYEKKPFKSFEDLYKQMLSIFETANKQNKLKILNSHPDLADKTRIGLLTEDSNKEQNNAGLDRCSEKEFEEFKKLNIKYKKKFGFPFICAVKGKSKTEILNNFKERVKCDIIGEFNQAIKQVKKIATLRINEINKK